MLKFGVRLFEFFASYALVIVILFFLLLLTLFGTLEQVHTGLFEAQKKYFNSLILVHELPGGLPLPLPGGRLLMALLFINLLCGAIIRVRKGWSKLGTLITHLGILLILLGGWVMYHFSTDGHMTLYAGDSSDEYVSYYEWEVALTPAGGGEQLVIPHRDLQQLADGGEREFYAQGLPFRLTLGNFMRNCQPVQAPFHPRARGGFVLDKLPLDKEAERNVAGLEAAVYDAQSGKEQQGILWGIAPAPWTVNCGGRDWMIDLRHKRWKVPFTIVLDKFTKEDHPGIQMAKSYMSDVTMIEGGQRRKVRIQMNEPLRHKGFTLFQSGWGPQNAPPGVPLFSTFSVVRNPADQWPKYACYIIALGMLVQFGLSLLRHLRDARTSD